MQQAGVKGIHIAERDTQRARDPKPRGKFVNTWSVEGFVAEGLQPSELGWGTHEKAMPPDGGPSRLRLRRGDLPDAAGRRHAGALLDARPRRPSTASWSPTTSRSRSPTISRCARTARWSTGRPATTPTTRATTRCCRCTRWPAGQWKPQDDWHILTRTRSSTASTSSACCSTATPRTPTGTARSSRSRRRAQLAPYQNATGLQVTSAVLAGIVWMLENPERGIVEADEMDFRRCLEMQRPYLGPVVGHYTDWTPLDGPRRAVPGGHRHAAIRGSSGTCWSR